MSPGIDLHIHSTASDGSLSPNAIVTRATELKLAAIAITDHDTIAAHQELASHKSTGPLELISGVEISADWPAGFGGKGSLHILGYDFDPQHPGLNQLLTILTHSRSKRIPRMVERLQQLGIPIHMDALGMAQRSNQSLGRPHIAEWLVDNGYAASIKMAFDQLIGNGCPAYVDKERAPCSQAIQTIRDAGGVAVLAHPGILKISPGPQFERFLKALQAAGIQGMEVYYPDHSPEQTRYFEKTALALGLVSTGGTDFHGDLIPDLQMGTGRGNFTVAHELLSALRQPPTAQPR